MSLQSGNTFLAGDAYAAIRSNAAGWKAQAQNALQTLEAGSVSSDFVFRMLDQLAGAITALTAWESVVGLNTYATAQSYPSTMTTDCAACITAAQATIAWVVANFPASNGFLQAYTLNADGSRTARLFTVVQTAGLQTALSSFIATIG